MSAYFTKENITLIISILGACAWIPVLVEMLKKPKIDCKVLKYDWLTNGCFGYYVPFEDGFKKEYKGTIFVIGVRFISRYADFPISDVKVRVKFDSMSDEMDTFVHYSPRFEVRNFEKMVYFEKSNNILFCPVLRKNEIYDLETHFIVESKKYDVEYLKFIFINMKGKEQIILLNKDDFKNATKVFS